LRAREESLNLPPSSLVALDYFGVDSWADMAKYNWIPAYWRQKNPARTLIWSIALTMKGTALKEVAAGAVTPISRSPRSPSPRRSPTPSRESDGK